MNISAVTGVGRSLRRARAVAGQQQAFGDHNPPPRRSARNDRQAEEVDLKKTETVTQDQGASGSGDARRAPAEHRRLISLGSVELEKRALFGRAFVFSAGIR